MSIRERGQQAGGTPWDASLYFWQVVQWDINYGLECDICGDPAEWELMYAGIDCPGESRYRCTHCYKEEFRHEIV